MSWDPAVLRKYNTTGHFRLLNQLRAEIKGNPLIRPKDGETVGAANRSRRLVRAIEEKAAASAGARARRSLPAGTIAAHPRASRHSLPVEADPASLEPGNGAGGSTTTFRERLNAIDLR